jgi:hypothetical protein
MSSDGSEGSDNEGGEGEAEPGDDNGGEEEAGDGNDGNGEEEAGDDNGGEEAGDNSGSGSDNSGPGSEGGNCTTADLTPGAVVHEAELNIENGQATFEKVELSGKEA